MWWQKGAFCILMAASDRCERSLHSLHHPFLSVVNKEEQFAYRWVWLLLRLQWNKGLWEAFLLRNLILRVFPLLAAPGEDAPLGGRLWLAHSTTVVTKPISSSNRANNHVPVVYRDVQSCKSLARSAQVLCYVTGRLIVKCFYWKANRIWRSSIAQPTLIGLNVGGETFDTTRHYT